MELRKISIILIIVKLPVITTWETEKCATSASIADFALVSHVIETVSRKQPLTCIIACELNPRCASVNFDFSTTSCEMSDKIVESHPGDLHPRLGWLYISILYREDLTLGSDSHVTPVPTVPTKSVCDHVICENGGTCLETSDPGKFKCLCFPNYTGRSCEVCFSLPLGMESRKISDEQFTASSWTGGREPWQARLENPLSCWQAKRQNLRQYLQVNFSAEKIVTGISTQGDPTRNSWVTEYKVLYSSDGDIWDRYEDPDGAYIFVANDDRASVVFHEMYAPVVATMLRVKPLVWNKRIALRLEIHGCGFHS